MSEPTLTLSELKGEITITLAVDGAEPLHTKSGTIRPFEMLPTLLWLHYYWDAKTGGWKPLWSVCGRRRLKSGAWSTKGAASIGDWQLDAVPAWIADAVAAHQPTTSLGGEQARADERNRCAAELRRHSSERMDVGVKQVASGDDGGLAVISYASAMDRAARLLESGELTHEQPGGEPE